MAARWSSPVRYVECDQQGVVFNAHYLTWADEASYPWWAAHGLPCIGAGWGPAGDGELESAGAAAVAATPAEVLPLLARKIG